MRTSATETTTTTLSRRGIIASGVATGLTTLVLPSVAAAASVGGAGSEPTYPGNLALTNPDTTPAYNGHPIGGYWSMSYSPPGWSFSVDPRLWSLPLSDSGKTTAPFTYEYQLSPNNGVSWHTLTWNGSWGGWEVLIGYDVMAYKDFDDPRDANSPYYFTEPNLWAPNGYNFLYNAILRARDNGEVIDMSTTFWLG